MMIIMFNCLRCLHPLIAFPTAANSPFLGYARNRVRKQTSRSFSLCNIIVHCNQFYSILMEVQTISVSIEALCISSYQHLMSCCKEDYILLSLTQYMHSKQIGKRAEITGWTQSEST